MRGARWLLLVAIAVILGGVGVSYRAQKKALRDQAPPRPQALPPELSSSADHYTHSETIGGRSVYDLEADGFRQSADSSHVDLQRVALKIYNQDATAYDLVKSAAATFYVNEGRLYADGDVEITVGMPLLGQPSSDLVSIHSSGVTFDQTGRADTDRPSTFVFQGGQGKCTGANYDPGTRQLLMKSDVELDWNPRNPGAKPMKIQAAALYYHELQSEIWLKPWGRLTRGNSVIEGQDDIIKLASVGEGETRKTVIRQIMSVNAHGVDEYPDRKLQYSAPQLLVDLNDSGAVQMVRGASGVQLISTSRTGETNVRSDNVMMEFDSKGQDSVLRRVLPTGNAVVRSKPLPFPGRPLSETRELKSQSLEMLMRPDGSEIATVLTHAPGTLEFFPNLPAQHHRTLDGDNMVIAYGPGNRIQSFRADKVKTQTEPTAEEAKRNRRLAITTSRELTATFDPKTSRLASMEQTGDFTYDEGDRRARSSKATLDSTRDVILLQGSARIWDSTGSTSADHIRMDQNTGDFTAEGGVNSSRMPDSAQKKDPGMLSGDEPLQAQARKMEAKDRNRKIHYEGSAVMWQGANRVQADAIDIDREKRALTANGQVITNLWEQPKAASKAGGKQAQPPAPVETVVHAARLLYTDQSRQAYYTGGVTLDRLGLKVKSRELRAFLSNSGDSSLEKAFADGNVEIVQSGRGRTRTGSGEHSEYYAADQKVVLRGNRAKMVDSVSGTTEGLELIYFPNDDRLLVNGTTGDPVKTLINRAVK